MTYTIEENIYENECGDYTTNYENYGRGVCSSLDEVIGVLMDSIKNPCRIRYIRNVNKGLGVQVDVWKYRGSYNGKKNRERRYFYISQGAV